MRPRPWADMSGMSIPPHNKTASLASAQGPRLPSCPVWISFAWASPPLAAPFFAPSSLLVAVPLGYFVPLPHLTVPWRMCARAGLLP